MSSYYNLPNYLSLAHIKMYKFPVIDDLFSIGPYFHRFIYDFSIMGLHHNILEVGSFNGYSTSAWIAALDDCKFNFTVCDVNISNYVKKITKHRAKTFQEKSSKIINDSYDMVFLDGGHDLETAGEEILLLLKYRPKTIIVHDTMLPQKKFAGARLIKAVFDNHKNYQGLTMYDKNGGHFWTLGLSCYSCDDDIFKKIKNLAARASPNNKAKLL